MLLKIVYLLVRRIPGLAVLVLREDLAKDAELLALRHENAVLRRRVGWIRYEPADRVWFAALAPLLPRRRWTEIFPVTPATLLAWHRRLAASKYDTSNSRKPGRPPTVPGIARVVVRLAKENPLSGYRRIHGELTKLGIAVAPSTVWKMACDEDWCRILSAKLIDEGAGEDRAVAAVRAFNGAAFDVGLAARAVPVRADRPGWAVLVEPDDREILVLPERFGPAGGLVSAGRAGRRVRQHRAVIEAGIPSGAASQASGSDIGPDPLAPGIGQRVELGVVALSPGRDPRVPVPGHSGKCAANGPSPAVATRCFRPLL